MIKKLIKLFESGQIGSALIMTVVLTVLLSIVAVMFVLVARMDSAATSNIADNKMVDSAAKSIIEIISKELVLDTPGVAKESNFPKLNYPQYYDYQDYPDVNDAWLASLEPQDPNNTARYYWRQISDVTGYLRDKSFSLQNVNVEPIGLSTTVYVPDYPKIKVDSDGRFLDYDTENIATNGVSADADGDGIADSKWFELTDMRTSKGRAIYAAVRVIDNCAMININTAHSFNADSTEEGKIDGSTQMQINLAGLLKTGDNIDNLHNARCGSASQIWADYENKVIWQYGLPNGDYRPFDISDELELRYRYCIDGRIKARIEKDANNTIRGRNPDFGNLYDANPDTLTDWESRITDPCDQYADRRHLLTTLSLDRIIDPNGDRMFNIRTDPCAQLLYNRLQGCIDANYSTVPEDDLHAYIAQFAANVVDRGDNDACVSVVRDYKNREFYGMARPYIYISEIARNFWVNPDANIGDANVYRSYTIELFKEFYADEVFEPWQLMISGIGGASPSFRNIPIYASDFNDRGGRFYVIIFQDDSNNANLSDRVKFWDSPENGAKGVDPNIPYLIWDKFFLGYSSDGNSIWSIRYDFYIGTDKSDVGIADVNTGICPAGVTCVPNLTITAYPPDLQPSTTYYWRVDGRNDANGLYRKGPVWNFTTWDKEPNSVKEYIQYDKFIFGSGTAIQLWRPVGASYILADSEANLPDWLINYTGSNGVRSFQRDISWSNRLKRIWDINGIADYNTGTLGGWNWYWSGPANPIQPWYYDFRNVGDAAMLFIKSTYLGGSNPSYQIPPGVTTTEESVRLDINDHTMQNIFKYITALGPYDPNEMRVKGRININTAPAFIIRQLPWVTWVNRTNGDDVNVADAIVAYRDKTRMGSIDYSDRYNATGIQTVDPVPRVNISESPGFGSVGELLNVINKNPTGNEKKHSIRYCGIDGRDQLGFPDLTVDLYTRTDSMVDDLEEEELIFARLSDLVTVRSDMFTAYILVRIGTDGPQKRFIVILDRSSVRTAGDKVSIRAFQLVPEAR